MKNISSIKVECINLFINFFGRFINEENYLKILTFHDFDSDVDQYSVCKKNFLDYLSIINDEGYKTVSCMELFNNWNEYIFEKKILLTFDDGYSSHINFVMDKLLERRMKGVFFIITSVISSRRKKKYFQNGIKEFLCFDDLVELNKNGLEIGSHSHTHTFFTKSPESEIIKELGISKKILEDTINSPVNWLSYPYGRGLELSRKLSKIISDSGYRLGFNNEGFSIKYCKNLLDIPRINVDYFDNEKTFRNKLNGKYNLISLVRGNARKHRN